MTVLHEAFICLGILGPINPHGAALSAVRPDDMLATAGRHLALCAMCIGGVQGITLAMERV